jgi:hypothetical protein
LRNSSISEALAKAVRFEYPKVVEDREFQRVDKEDPEGLRYTIPCVVHNGYGKPQVAHGSIPESITERPGQRVV